MVGFHFWQFVGGIAVFVFAMSMIESSIKQLAGRSFKKFLQKQSQSKIKMLVSSTFITAILQSSSVVLLMVLSFVGAGILNMRGALAATLGSNLGTTLDSWVIALVGFKIEFDAISYPILAISFIGLLFAKKNSKWLHATHLLIGFAFIFVSLEWLKGSVDKSFENNLFGLNHLHYLAFIPIGFVITAIIQSSSVTIAITLTALYNQLIPFESAAAIVIGSELGTTLKFLLGSVGGIADKKRVALGNVLLNAITMFIAVLVLYPLIYLIQDVFFIRDPMIALVVFQSGINFLSILLFYPFLGLIANFLGRLFSKDNSSELTHFIRKTDPALPGDALELAEKEIIHLLNETLKLNLDHLGIEKNIQEGWMQNVRNFTSDVSKDTFSYEEMKMLQGEILEYLTEIPKSELNELEITKTAKIVNIVRHILRSAKNIKDIKHNIEDFNSAANDELYNNLQHVRSNVQVFYTKYQQLLNTEKNINRKSLSPLNEDNQLFYSNAITEMLQLLKDGKINELDSTN